MSKRRYRIASDGHNGCTMDVAADEDLLSPACTREFWAPDDGGYVYEVFEHRPGTSGQQVCEMLLDRGVTLLWNGRRPLAHLIRREARRYYAMQRGQQ